MTEIKPKNQNRDYTPVYMSDNIERLGKLISSIEHKLSGDEILNLHNGLTLINDEMSDLITKSIT